MENKNLKDAFPDTPENFHRRVLATLARLPKEKETILMKIGKLSAKRIAIVALVACTVLACTAFAAGQIRSYVSHSSSASDYTSMPDTAQIQKDIGIAPKTVETFTNGLTFASGHIINSEARGEGDVVIEKFKELSLSYGQGIDIIMNKTIAGEAQTGAVAGAHGGITLYYDSTDMKFLPPDYVMTEQDKADEASGKYVFSYGSREVEVTSFQFLTWTDGGIKYMIMARDSALTRESLVQMAGEIIG